MNRALSLTLAGLLVTLAWAPNASAQAFSCTIGDRFVARAQQASSWCWAASGEMAVRTAWGSITPGPTISQCQEAAVATGNTCCGSSSPIATCNVTGWPKLDGTYGVTSAYFNATTARPDILFGASSTDTRAHSLTGQLCGAQKRPVVFTWKECGGGSHMMVVKGISVDNTASHAQWVSYVDPSPVGTGGQTWKASYAKFYWGNACIGTGYSSSYLGQDLGYLDVKKP